MGVPFRDLPTNGRTGAPATFRDVVFIVLFIDVYCSYCGHLTKSQVIGFLSQEYPVAALSASLDRSTEWPVFLGQAHAGHRSTTLTMTVPFRPLTFKHLPQCLPPCQSRALSAA